jgi:hypothetical protein
MAVVQGLGVAKLAFGEIGKAIQGNAQALKRLTPEGKKFVHEWNKNFKPVFKSIQSDAQKALLPGLTKALETVAHSPLLGVLRKNITATAGVLGKLAQQMAHTLAAPATAKDVGTILRGNTGFLDSLGKGAINVVHGFVQIGVAMQPMIKWFGQLAQEAGNWFDKWAESARSSGRLTRFFEHSRQVLTQLGHIVRDVGIALLHIFHAAAPQGQSFLNIIERAARSLRRWTESLRGKNTLRDYFKGAADSAKGWGRILRDTGIALFNIFKGGSKLGRSMNTDLQRAAATFRRWTESASGQNKIRKFFDDAKPAIYETARLIGAVVKAFASLGAHQGAAPLIRQIRVQLVPALQKLIDATTRQFAPVLIQTLIALATAISNLSGSSGPLVVFLKTINLLLNAFNALISNVRFLQPLLFALLGTAAVGRAVKLAGGILNIRSAWSKVTTSMKAAEVQADKTALAMQNASRYQPRGTQTGAPPAAPPPTFRQRFAQRLRGGVALPGQYYDPYGTGPMPLIPGGRANLGTRFKGLASGVGFGNIAAFGGLAAGSFLGNQGTAGKVGNVLSSAGIGALFGEQAAGPWGAAVGALGGALIAANQSFGIFKSRVTESQKAMEHYNTVVEQGKRDLDAFSQAHENLKNAQINTRDSTTRLLGAQIQWHDALKEQQKAFKGMDAAQIEAFKKTDKGKRIIYDVRTAFSELTDAEKEVTQAHKDQGAAFGDINKGARKGLHDTLNAASAARKQVQAALADAKYDFRLAPGDVEGRTAQFDKARAAIVASFIKAREAFAKDAREKGYKLVADVAQAQANAARALNRVPTRVQVAVALSEIHARRFRKDIDALIKGHGDLRVTPKLWDNKGFQRNIIRLLHQYGIANISPALVGTDKFRKVAEPFLAKYKLLDVTPVIKKPKLPPVKTLGDVGKYLSAAIQNTFAPVVAAVNPTNKGIPTTKLGATLAVTDLSVQRLLGIKRMPPRSVVLKPGVEPNALRNANHLLGKQGDGLTHDRTAKIDVLAPDLPTALTQLKRVTAVKTRETTVKVNVIPVFPHGDGIVGVGGLGDGILGMAKKAVKNDPGTVLKALGNLAVKGGGAVKGLKDFILDDLALGEKFGLALSSGFREGAITSTGNVSLHSVGQAIDMTGPAAAMAAYAKAEAGRKGIAEVIYTGPGGKGGWYPGVGWTTSIPKSVLDDHHDHVHVGARFAAGGFVVPGARVAADTVPALLSPGEVVFTDSGQQMMEQYAPGLLNQVIANQAPHFGAGGVVKPQRFRTGGPTLPNEDPHTRVAVAPPPPWVSKFNALNDPERKKRRKQGNVKLPVGYFWYEDNTIGVPKVATKAARDVALPEMRAENFKLMKRIWNAAREFYPHAGKSMPQVYGTGKDQSWLFPNLAEVWQWAKGNNATGAYAIPPGQRKVAWPLFEAGGGANKNPWTNLRKNVARRALIHEWAHVFQWPDLARWETEGGAEAFAKRHGKQIFNKLGLPFQFNAADTEYDKFRQRVEKKPHASHWIDSDQFESPEKFRRGGWARFKGGTKKKAPKGTTFPKVSGPVEGLLPGAFAAGYDVGTAGGQLDFSALYQLGALQAPPKPAKKSKSSDSIGKTAKAAMSYAAKAAQQTYGWAGDQWAALNQIWQHESHWDYKAVNPKPPHAVGIPQRNPQQWPIDDDYRTNPKTQVDWGLNYIHDHYGTPVKAWAKWQAYAAKHGGQGSYRLGGLVQHFKDGGVAKIAPGLAKATKIPTKKQIAQTSKADTATWTRDPLPKNHNDAFDYKLHRWRTQMEFLQKYATRDTEDEFKHKYEKLVPEWVEKRAKRGVHPPNERYIKGLEDYQLQGAKWLGKQTLNAAKSILMRRGGVVGFKGGGKVPKPKSTFISKAANAATGVYPQILPLLAEKTARMMAHRFGQEGFADMLDDQTHIGKMERLGDQSWKVPLTFSGPNPASLDLKLWRTDEHTYYGRARHLKAMRKGGKVKPVLADASAPKYYGSKKWDSIKSDIDIKYNPGGFTPYPHVGYGWHDHTPDQELLKEAGYRHLVEKWRKKLNEAYATWKDTPDGQRYMRQHTLGEARTADKKMTPQQRVHAAKFVQKALPGLAKATAPIKKRVGGFIGFKSGGKAPKKAPWWAADEQTVPVFVGSPKWRDIKWGIDQKYQPPPFHPLSKQHGFLGLQGHSQEQEEMHEIAWQRVEQRWIKKLNQAYADWKQSADGQRYQTQRTMIQSQNAAKTMTPKQSKHAAQFVKKALPGLASATAPIKKRVGGFIGRWRHFRAGTKQPLGINSPAHTGAAFIGMGTTASADPTIRGTLDNLAGIKGDTRKARQRAIQFLKELNRELQSKTYEQIENVAASIKGEIRKLREGGVSSQERVKITRLRAALSEAEANLGFRIGSLVKQVQDLGTKQARRENRGGLKLRSDVATGQFSDSSVEYANRAQDLIATQNDDLRQRIKLQREALAKAKRKGNKHVIAEVQQGLNDLNDQLAEGIVSWREAAKNVADTMRQAAKDASDKIIASIQDTLSNITSQASGFDAYQRLQGTADTPAGLRAKAGFIINKTIPAIQAGAAKVSPAFNPNEPGGHTFGLGDATAWLGIPRAASGGHIDPSPGGTPLIVGEGGYRETVLSSDPAQGGRTDRLLGQFLASTGRMAASGWPSPQGDVQDWIDSSIAAGPTTVSPGLAKAMAAQGESFGAKNEDTIAWLQGLGSAGAGCGDAGRRGDVRPAEGAVGARGDRPEQGLHQEPGHRAHRGQVRRGAVAAQRPLRPEGHDPGGGLPRFGARPHHRSGHPRGRGRGRLGRGEEDRQGGQARAVQPRQEGREARQEDGRWRAHQPDSWRHADHRGRGRLPRSRPDVRPEVRDPHRQDPVELPPQDGPRRDARHRRRRRLRPDAGVRRHPRRFRVLRSARRRRWRADVHPDADGHPVRRGGKQRPDRAAVSAHELPGRQRRGQADHGLRRPVHQRARGRCRPAQAGQREGSLRHLRHGAAPHESRHHRGTVARAPGQAGRAVGRADRAAAGRLHSGQRHPGHERRTGRAQEPDRGSAEGRRPGAGAAASGGVRQQAERHRGAAVGGHAGHEDGHRSAGEDGQRLGGLPVRRAGLHRSRRRDTGGLRWRPSRSSSTGSASRRSTTRSLSRSGRRWRRSAPTSSPGSGARARSISRSPFTGTRTTSTASGTGCGVSCGRCSTTRC